MANYSRKKSYRFIRNYWRPNTENNSNRASLSQ